MNDYKKKVIKFKYKKKNETCICKFNVIHCQWYNLKNTITSILILTMFTEHLVNQVRCKLCRYYL